MIKMIFIQLKNSWRKQVWICVELFVVFCLLWYIVDYLFVLGYNYSLPSHRSLGHTWQVGIGVLPETHPDYRAEEADSLQTEANYFRLIDRVRQARGVVALAVVSNSATPGGGSYYGRELGLVGDSSKWSSGQFVEHDPYRGDLFDVFRYTYVDGQPVRVTDFDWSVPNAMVVGQRVADRVAPGGSAVGLHLADNRDDYVVQGVVGDTKRFDYQRPQGVFYPACRVDGSNWQDMQIAVRSSDGLADAAFAASFRAEMGKALRIGNFYLQGIRSYESIHAETDERFGQAGTLRAYISVMLFFLLNIMLCVMGTFWYRVHTRRSEVGLRMAMGAPRTGIRRMFMLEGVCLLTVVVLPAMFVEGQFVYLGMIDTLGGGGQSGKEVCLPDRQLLRFLLTNLLTWLVLAVTICLAVWLPAGKASRIAPAEALLGE